MEIRIRKATKADLKSIYKIEKRSFPPELRATHHALNHRFETFGIWIAEMGGTAAGFFTCVPAKLSWPEPELEKILGHRHPQYRPWFDEYKKGGEFNTLYITSTAVDSEHQGKGAGKAMVEYSLQLAKGMGLSYRASVLRVSGYRAYHKDTGRPAKDYIEEVKKGTVKNPFLGIYLKLGFELGKVISNYEPDRSSLNHGVFAYKKVV